MRNSCFVPVLVTLALVVLPPICSAQDLEYIFSAPPQALIYDDVTGVGSGIFELVVEEVAGNPGYPNDTIGFAMGIQYVDDYVELVWAEPTGILTAMNDGDGPEFFGTNLDPLGGPGFTVGCVYSIFGNLVYAFPEPEPVVALEFQTDADALAGNTSNIPVPLTWCDCLGNPLISNTMVAENGTDDTVIFSHGELLLVPLVGPPFIRGDADGSGDFAGLVDGLFVLTWVFQNGPEPPCLSASDADGDGVQNGLVDAIYILDHQFGSGPPPPAPHPECGQVQNPFDCNVTPCP